MKSIIVLKQEAREAAESMIDWTSRGQDWEDSSTYPKWNALSELWLDALRNLAEAAKERK